MNEKRETTSAPMRYVILALTMDSASGRAEDSRSVSRKFGTLCQIFVKQIKQYQAAAGKSGCHRIKRPVWTRTVYVL